MEPNIQINFLAVGLAVFASFLVGFIWYSFLFSKSWQKEMGYTKKMEIDKKMMIKSLLINVIGTFLMAWVLAHNIAAWDPKSWGIDKAFMPPVGAALSSAIFTWLGFYVPQDLNKVSFQMRSWKLFLIDTSYNLVSLLVAAFILVFMK